MSLIHVLLIVVVVGELQTIYLSVAKYFCFGFLATFATCLERIVGGDQVDIKIVPYQISVL